MATTLEKPVSLARIAAFSVLCLARWGAFGADYYVSTAGSDRNPGTRAKPFRTIQKAANVMAASDTCYVRGGTYRETVTLKTSGAKGSPIRFVAYPGEAVTLSGTEPVKGRWQAYKGPIYKTTFDGDFEQLFVDGKMMIEARWPNMKFEEIWDRSKWAAADFGSRRGLMICRALAKTGVDWTGAVATLNVAQQFWTWTRTVTGYRKGSPQFSYASDSRIGAGRGAGPTWGDDYFFLSGKLEALDYPTEWFNDPTSRTLYLYTEDGKSPDSHKVEYKKRIYAFDGKDCGYIEMSGFRFFATTFRFQNANHIVIDNCRLRFPTYSRLLTETNPPSKRRPSPATLIVGAHNTIRNTSLAFSNTHGLVMMGQYNLIENCIVHDVCWNGSLMYSGIKSTSGMSKKEKDKASHNRVARCTVYGVGNVGILFSGRESIVEYNDVYGVGRTCRDISGLYTSTPQAAGSVARYNWVHDSTCIGIRGDDQTRGLTLHHNVVWNCRYTGLTAKGDANRVFSNTVLGTGGGGALRIPTRPEPKKSWTPWPTLAVQNANSRYYNNVAEYIFYHGAARPKKGNVSNNLELHLLAMQNVFVDPENMDFRPRKGSPLIDAGRVVPGITDGYKGKAPDLGAYEYGGEFWTAGADWKDEWTGPPMIVKLEAPGARCALPMRQTAVEKLRKAGMSQTAVNNLQAFYSTLWTSAKLKVRQLAIHQRLQYKEGTAEWKRYHKIVAQLHNEVWREFVNRGREALNEDESKLFDKVVGPRDGDGT